ncbi:MAG: metal ABC transporter permease [Burkholderiales bacterium]|nr:metal ABC transporter permease [Phycisphaerae bacterium]
MTSLAEYAEIAVLLAPSLATAAAFGIGAGIVGVFVLLRREAMVALTLPQVVAIGAAIGLRFNSPTLWPAIASTATAIILLSWARGRNAGPWLLPSLYVAGISFSFLIIAGAGAHVSELQNVFTGIDVAVTPDAALLAIPVVIIAGLFTAMLWRRWLLIAQAPLVARLAGLAPAGWDTLFLILAATVLMVGTHALGAVIVLALLFLPAATVLPWCRRIPPALVTAPLMAMVYLATGFVLSIEMNWPLSQSVGAAGFGIMIVSNIFAALRR